MTWYDRIPKAELHIHLEGAIPHEALFELITKYGGDPLIPDVSALAKRFAYTNFEHFIEVWIWKNGFLREYDDLTLIAELFARSLAEQNIRYAEVFYSPTPFEARGLSVADVTRAVRAGLDRVSETEIALVADLVRNHGAAVGLDAVAKLAEVREYGVIGVGVGGMEAGYAQGEFAPVFDAARAAGFRTTVHAGEAAGAESVWEALRTLAPDRIGHGTRAAENPALIDHLAQERIPLEMCPVSNVRTGVVARLAEHPIRRFFDAGLLVTANSDDPAMFQTSLAGEYRALERDLGFTRDEFRRLIRNAIEASWLPPERKATLAEEFSADPAWGE
jgi:adenosine deaminase